MVLYFDDKDDGYDNGYGSESVSVGKRYETCLKTFCTLHSTIFYVHTCTRHSKAINPSISQIIQASAQNEVIAGGSLQGKG